MAIVRPLVTVAGEVAESLTWNVISDVPPTVGVPVMLPFVAFIVRPAGRVPLANDHV
jgi:hypothetical protein